MYKVVESDGKFKIKQLDQGGSTVGLLEETFNSEAAANDFIEALERGVAHEDAVAQQPAEPVQEPGVEVSVDDEKKSEETGDSSLSGSEEQEANNE